MPEEETILEEEMSEKRDVGGDILGNISVGLSNSLL